MAIRERAQTKILFRENDVNGKMPKRKSYAIDNLSSGPLHLLRISRTAIFGSRKIFSRFAGEMYKCINVQKKYYKCAATNCEFSYSNMILQSEIIYLGEWRRGILGRNLVLRHFVEPQLPPPLRHSIIT